MKLFKENSAFTLIEIMLTLAIIVLVIPLASNMMIQSFNIFNSGVHRMSTGQRVELALEEIGNSLRSATTEPSIDGTAALKTYKFKSYNSSIMAPEDIVIELDGSANDFNLLLNDRIIAENITEYYINLIDGEIFELIIEYRVRENESDSSVLKEKKLEVYPKNLS